MKRLSRTEMKFSSTYYQYKRNKKDFLDKFSSIDAWGNWTSMRRLSALTELFKYLDETRDLIDEDETLKEVIYMDHVNLLLGKVTPMPSELKMSSVSDQPDISNGQKFEHLYFSLKTEQRVSTSVFNGLASIGKVSPWCEGIAKENNWEGDSDADNTDNDFQDVTAKLRRMRGCLYKKSKSGDDVRQDLLEYQLEVESFTERFADALSEAEHSIWKCKVEITTKDVLEIMNLKIENWKEPAKPRRPSSNTGQLLTSPNCLHSLPHCKNSYSEESSNTGQPEDNRLFQMVENWTESQVVEYSEAFTEGRVTLDGFAKFMKDKKNIDVTENQLEEFEANLSERYRELKPVKLTDHLEASVHELFESIIKQEKVAANLPNPPGEESEETDLDQEIEKRWLQLKVFNRTWLTSGDQILAQVSTQVTTGKDEKAVKEKAETLKVDKNDETPINFCSDLPKEIVDANLKEPEADLDARRQFNDWFEEKLEMKARKLRCPGDGIHNDDGYKEDKKQKPQLSNNDTGDFNNQNITNILLFMQAYFVLLITTCKTLHDHLSSFPQTMTPHYPLHPTDKYSMHSTKSVTRAMECESIKPQCKCFCVMVTRAIASAASRTSSACRGVHRWSSWVGLQVQNLTEKLKLTFVRFVMGDQFEITRVRQAKIVKVNYRTLSELSNVKSH